MKSICKLLGIAAFAMTLAACSNNDEIDNNDAKGTFTLMGKAANVSTKSELGDDGTSVLWSSGGESIAVYDGVGVTKFTTNDTGASATFAGTPNTTEAEAYYAMYPYIDGVTYANNVFTFDFPAAQTAKAGNLPEGVNLAYAVAKPNAEKEGEADVEAYFYNAASVLKFKVESTLAERLDNVIIFNKEDNTQLGGTYTIDPAGTDGAVIQGDPTGYLTLSGDFTTDAYYYMVVPAKTYSGGLGIILTIEGRKFIYPTTTNELTLTRSKIYNIGLIQPRWKDMIEVSE